MKKLSIIILTILTFAIYACDSNQAGQAVDAEKDTVVVDVEPQLFDVFKYKNDIKYKGLQKFAIDSDFIKGLNDCKLLTDENELAALWQRNDFADDKKTFLELGKTYLYSVQHTSADLIKVTACMYAEKITLWYLIYSTEGELIDKFIVAAGSSEKIDAKWNSYGSFINDTIYSLITEETSNADTKQPIIDSLKFMVRSKGFVETQTTIEAELKAVSGSNGAVTITFENSDKEQFAFDKINFDLSQFNLYDTIVYKPDSKVSEFIINESSVGQKYFVTYTDISDTVVYKQYTEKESNLVYPYLSGFQPALRDSSYSIIIGGYGKYQEIFGAFTDTGWISCNDIPQYIKEEFTYNIYSSDGLLGSYKTASHIKMQEMSDCSGITFDTLPEKQLYGITGKWDAMPYKYKKLGAEEIKNPEYSKLLLDFLSKQGLSEVEAKIQNIFSCDLEGDSIKEFIIDAYNIVLDDNGMFGKKNSYSVILLIKQVDGVNKVFPILKNCFTKDAESIEDDMFDNEVKILIDVNNDKILDIIVTDGYYEGGGDYIFIYENGKFVSVLSCVSGA